LALTMVGAAMFVMVGYGVDDKFREWCHMKIVDTVPTPVSRVLGLESPTIGLIKAKNAKFEGGGDADVSPEPTTGEKVRDTLTQIVCRRCGSYSHKIEDCPKAQHCMYCNSDEHKTSECKNPSFIVRAGMWMAGIDPATHKEKFWESGDTHRMRVLHPVTGHMVMATVVFDRTDDVREILEPLWTELGYTSYLLNSGLEGKYDDYGFVDNGDGTRSWNPAYQKEGEDWLQEYRGRGFSAIEADELARLRVEHSRNEDQMDWLRQMAHYADDDTQDDYQKRYEQLRLANQQVRDKAEQVYSGSWKHFGKFVHSTAHRIWRRKQGAGGGKSIKITGPTVNDAQAQKKAADIKSKTSHISKVVFDKKFAELKKDWSGRVLRTENVRTLANVLIEATNEFNSLVSELDPANTSAFVEQKNKEYDAWLEKVERERTQHLKSQKDKHESGQPKPKRKQTRKPKQSANESTWDSFGPQTETVAERLSYANVVAGLPKDFPKGGFMNDRCIHQADCPLGACNTICHRACSNGKCNHAPTCNKGIPAQTTDRLEGGAKGSRLCRNCALPFYGKFCKHCSCATCKKWPKNCTCGKKLESAQQQQQAPAQQQKQQQQQQKPVPQQHKASQSKPDQDLESGWIEVGRGGRPPKKSFESPTPNKTFSQENITKALPVFSDHVGKILGNGVHLVCGQEQYFALPTHIWTRAMREVKPGGDVPLPAKAGAKPEVDGEKCLISGFFKLPQGVKPLKVSTRRDVDVGNEQVGTYCGFDPTSRGFVFSACKYYLAHYGDLHHDASTDKGSCGGLILNRNGEVEGIHYSGQSGDSTFPNVAFVPTRAGNV